MERKIVYFEEITPENTEITFNLVQERLKDSGIQSVVLASTTGATARKALDLFAGRDVKLIVVPHQFDFKQRENRFPPELTKTLRESGHEVHFGTMLFHTDQLYGSNTPTLLANLLRTFSQGFKVCFEIVFSAVDAGLLKSGEQVIAVAGTGKGADTALVIQAASSQSFKNLRVNEIICKPLNPLNIEEVKEKLAQENAR
ncbi:MAG TPA: pyruvate kinase alpha/beta domain-containing protein [Methylomusa anaerophila]|uniref:Pyruvate kinase, alpha/beta domain n=1 Tax=Methylomusa anaerophila TaxID=1930071 RepID=A0A348AEU0_9FIRM|nr:pyruvate kinase alpha/beta domain-containing protein [Methylomusa anaerophila]BBB89588.1 pyruvate kinase, alpha/beta domain [Methylomusa anaerophila]HML89638.1 pyruvate kinase alpha/beta domain-containing protein [Methylomusa anaerophila]